MYINAMQDGIDCHKAKQSLCPHWMTVFSMTAGAHVLHKQVYENYSSMRVKLKSSKAGRRYDYVHAKTQRLLPHAPTEGQGWGVQMPP